MVAEKSLLFPSLPSATLISRLNKSFDGILCLWPFDVVPAASNTGSIQTAPSWEGWNSTAAGALSGGGAARQCLAGPKMRTPWVLLLSRSATGQPSGCLSQGSGLPESPAGWCRVLRAVLLRPSPSERWEPSGTTLCPSEGRCGKERQRCACPGSGEMSGNMELRPLLAVPY